MAEFYVGGTGIEDISPLQEDDSEVLYEWDLPAALKRDLDVFKQGVRENVSYLDCLWGELYGSINSAQWSNAITQEQADHLRRKYLF